MNSLKSWVSVIFPFAQIDKIAYRIQAISGRMIFFRFPNRIEFILVRFIFLCTMVLTLKWRIVAKFITVNSLKSAKQNGRLFYGFASLYYSSTWQSFWASIKPTAITNQSRSFCNKYKNSRLYFSLIILQSNIVHNVFHISASRIVTYSRRH